MCISLDMPKGLKGIDSTVHLTALGLWSQEMLKFLENDLISGSERFQDIVSKRDHIDVQPSTSSDRLIVIHNAHQVQTGDGQPIIEVPQIADNNPIDQVVQDSPKITQLSNMILRKMLIQH